MASQRGGAARGVALHRALADPERLGDLPLREVEVVAQRQHLALPAGQRARGRRPPRWRRTPVRTGRSAPGSSSGSYDGACRSTTRRWRMAERERLTTVCRRYACDVGAPQLVPPPVDGDEGVLHDLLGTPDVAEQKHGEPHEPHVVLVVQTLQRDVGVRVGCDGHLPAGRGHDSGHGSGTPGRFPLVHTPGLRHAGLMLSDGPGLPVLQDRLGRHRRRVVHESDTTVAFRDLNPQAPTHVLVIPRSHYPNAAALADGEPDTAVAPVRGCRRDR